MSRLSRVLFTCAIVLAAVVGPPVAAAAGNAFSGRAFVVGGTVEGIAVGPLADTGNVAPEGGSLRACLAAYPPSADDQCLINLPNVGDPTNGALRADVLHAAVVAAGDASRAEATVALFSVTAAGTAIDGAALSAQATAQCTNGVVSVAGSTEVLALSVNGQPVPIPVVGMKQTIVLPNLGTIVLNADPVATISGNHGRVEVRAVQIDLTNPVTGNETHLTVAFAEADIKCITPPPPPPCPSPAFVTSGGWVTGPEANVAAAGRTGDTWGHVIYRDRVSGHRLQATEITSTVFQASAVPGAPDIAEITGFAKVDGSGRYFFRLRLQDNGEPGRNDTLELESAFPTLTHALAKLAGGNVQFHRPCRK